MRKLLFLSACLSFIPMNAHAQSASSGNCITCDYRFESYYDDGMIQDYVQLGVMKAATSMSGVYINWYGSTFRIDNTPILNLFSAKQDVTSQLTPFASTASTSYGRGLLNLSNQAALATATGIVIPSTLDSFSDGVNSVQFSSANKVKLAGIATGATANSPDATLLNRANHTGTQAISTVSGLQTALDAKFANPTGTTSQYLRGDGSVATITFISAGQAPVQSVNGQTGAVSLTIPTKVSDLTNDLGFSSSGGSRTTSTSTLSLVGTGATGTQISSTKDSTVKYSVSTSATATIAGSAVSTVDLKICSTNSSTEANWTTVATSETSQAYSLAVALQGVTGMKEQLTADVPAGWYVKLVNSGSGTHSESFLAGQKTLY